VVEEADLLLAMAKLDMSPEEIARRLARDTKWVQLHLAIGVQPDPVKKALREKRMTVNTIAESMAVKEQHKAMAEQTLLRLAERSYPVDDAMARAEMRREIEKAEKAAAWETGKTARMEALKDMLAAHKWKFKLLHRRFDEPLDGNVDWSGVGDDLVEELEVHGVDAESIPAKHHGKKVGDLVTAYGGLSGLVVPKLGWHRDGEEYCTADAVVRVSLDKLVEVNNTLPEKDRWFESPKHIEADVDPEPVDWKEKHRIEREKRENRKSHVEFVIMQMAKAVREAEKYKLKEHFQRAYRQEWWEDCLAEFTNQYGETLFPDANGEDKVKARVAEFFDAPVIRENISLLMSLHYLFDDLSAARWYDTENDKLLAALDKFPACPAVDAAVAVVEKLKAGEL
jgi:hypothetical protein